MKIETIKERIANANLKLEKMGSTLQRHTAQLIKKSKALTDNGVDLSNYNKYEENSIDHDNYWELCEYEHKLEDIENTSKKIVEATKSLEKLQEQLKLQLEKDDEINNLIPECLNVFLNNWKTKCIEFYKELANEYTEITKVDYMDYIITEEELLKFTVSKKVEGSFKKVDVQKYSNNEIMEILNGEKPEYTLRSIKREIRYNTIKQFITSHFASDMALLEKVIVDNNLDIEMLNKIIDEDVKVKKETFINRINEVIGEIKDLKDLTISNLGEINGIAKGVKCNAKIETITAGGYNIQCWHYRVLINTIK